MTFTWNQAAERLVWTFVSAFGGTLVGANLIGMDVDALQAAAIAGCGAVVNAVTQLARWRLSVLPNPGEGLTRPGVSGDTRLDHADHGNPAEFHGQV